MIEPKSNSYLIAQEEAEAFLLNAYKNDSLHNSYIFAGPKGIGKATLAYKFARFLLSGGKKDAASLDISPTSPIYKQIESGAHPDFKVLKKSYNKTDTAKIIKAINSGKPLSAEELQEFKKSSVIKIDEVRTINEFLMKSSALGGYRIVIVDSIDDMNQNAANAILKTLEEPPLKTILILISHNINSLLPTIKSRCAKLFLKPLEENQVASLLRRYIPTMEEKNIKALATLSPQSIGKAIDYADFNVVKQNEMLQNIVYAKNNFMLKDLITLANELSKTEETFTFGFEIITNFLKENAHGFENVDTLSDLYFEANQIYNQTLSLNLDKKQAIIKIVTKIAQNI
ncbi:MAG: hypothetical protein R3Y43_01220 [Alphaproteobacteria bacterium]